jgi:hypothetical protein
LIGLSFLIKNCYKVAMLMSKGLRVGMVLTLIALTAALGVIAGCGGGDDDSAGATGAVASGENGGSDAAGGGAAEGNASDGGNGAASGEVAGDASGAVAGGGAEEGNSPDGNGASAGGNGAGGGSKAQAGKGGLSGGAARGGKAKKRSPSGSSGTEGSPATGSDSDFFAQADAICQERRADTRDNLGQYMKNGIASLEKNVKTVVDELIIPNLEKEMSGITALNPPASASDEVAALFDQIEGLIAAGKADPADLVLTGSAAAKSEEEAKQLGFGICGGI